MRSSRQRSRRARATASRSAGAIARERAPGCGAHGQAHGAAASASRSAVPRPGDREDADRHVLGGVGVGRGGHRGAVHAGDGRLVGLPDHTHASKL